MSFRVTFSPYLVKITTFLLKKKLQLTKNLLKSTTLQIIDWIGQVVVKQPSLIASTCVNRVKNEKSQ